MAALSDPFWGVRLHALSALSRMADSAHSIANVLGTIVRDDPKSDVRAQAAEMLAYRTKKAYAEPILIAVIEKDSSYSVIGNALMSLNHFDPERANHYAYTYLATSSPRDRMRQSAIGIIEMTKDQKSLDELIVLINQHDMPSRTRYRLIQSIGSMASIDSAKVYQVLWNLTNNGDYAIRGTAANELADIGNVETLHQLEAQAASRPDMKVTYDALLAKMRKRLGK